MNVWDLLILAAIVCLVVFAVRRIKNKKTGGCGFGCSCSDCPSKCDRYDKGAKK